MQKYPRNLFLFFSLLTPILLVAQTHKPEINIVGEFVYIQDIFTETAPNPRPVLQAPVLGKSYNLTTDYLDKIAKQYSVKWQPITQYESSKITRKSDVISADELSILMEKEILKEQLINGEAKLKLKLIGGYENGLNIEFGTKSLIRPTGISYNKPLKTATLTLSSFQTNGESYKIMAKVELTKEALVPSQRINAGDIITNAMMTKIYLPESEFVGNFTSEMNEIIGKEARRSLNANRPINPSDLKEPQIIKAKQAITIVVQTPQMQLTAKGRAIEGGSKGDVIKVENIQSGKIIQATIVGTGIAMVNL